MQLQSRNYVEQRARLNASVFDLVQAIGKSSSIEEACDLIAECFATYGATLLAVKIGDWADKQPVIRPYSNYPDSIKAVSENLKLFGGCPMTRECRLRLAPFSYRSIDRQKYSSLLERRFLQETDKLGYRDIAIYPVIAGQGMIITTFGLDQVFDEKLRAYSSGIMQHVAAALLANFPQVAKLFDGKVLSGLETRILTAHCSGMTNREICDRYDISELTLPLIWRSVEAKLEARNPYEAIHRAIVMGELDLPRILEP